jgi:hypothetical protein
VTAVTGAPLGVELERSYRRLLRALPPGYRAQREREMVDVMLELSPPDRRRPGLADVFDVAAIAASQWFRALFLPRRGEGRTAAAALAVILPVLLAYPIGAVGRGSVYIVQDVAGIDHYFRTHGDDGGMGLLAYMQQVAFQGLPFTAMMGGDWLAWACWAVAIGCLLAGRGRLARFPAAAGTLVFLAIMVEKIVENHQLAVMMNLGWLAIQVAALALLARPSLVERGRQLVPRSLLMGVALVVGGLGASGVPRSCLLLQKGTQIQFPLVIAALAVATLACLASSTGRVVLPFLTALFIPFAAARTLFPTLDNYIGGHTFQHLPVTEAAVAVLGLVVAYAICRLAASVAARLGIRAHSARAAPLPQ